MTTDTATAYCTAGHFEGSKPQVVPVAGNNDRTVPIFVVYHGSDYLDELGAVVRHPARMTYDAATTAIHHHEAGLPLPLAERRILEDFIDRAIDPRAIAVRRDVLHLSRLQRRGLLTLDGAGVPDLVDEVAALIALGRACGQHDRPLPCLECS
jgi:hypothetical protein